MQNEKLDAGNDFITLHSSIEPKAAITLNAYHYPDKFEHEGKELNNPYILAADNQPVSYSEPLENDASYTIKEERNVKAFHDFIVNCGLADELKSTLQLLSWNPETGEHFLSGHIEKVMLPFLVEDLKKHGGFETITNLISQWQERGMDTLVIEFLVKPGF